MTETAFTLKTGLAEMLKGGVIMDVTTATALETYDPRTFRARTFYDTIPRFRDGTDTPRAYLERCLETIAACEPVVQAFAALNEAGALLAWRCAWGAAGATPDGQCRLQLSEFDAVCAGGDRAPDERQRHARRRATHGPATRRRSHHCDGALAAGDGASGGRALRLPASRDAQ